MLWDILLFIVALIAAPFAIVIIFLLLYAIGVVILTIGTAINGIISRW